MTRKERDGNAAVVDGSNTVMGDGGGAVKVPPVMPWDSLCDDILAAYKAGQEIVVLQRFEELQAMPELDVLSDEPLCSHERPTTALEKEMKGWAQEEIITAAALEKVEFCWGRAVLAAKRIAGDDDEHIATIVEGFEERFGRPSEYLRVLAITADGALEAIRIHQLVEGHFSANAVTAALHKFPSLDADEARELLDFMRENNVKLTKDLAEQLEKLFVMRMKTKDAEDVFHEMCSAGVAPMSTRPYNFVFMKTTPFKRMSLVEYYLDMLDRGITPENSTFRILSKQTQNDGVAHQHFSSHAWGNGATNKRREDEERGGTQAFFAMCLTDLAKSKPEATLDDALNIFRRMDVEGTQLTNGSPVTTTLLSHFCRPGHLEDAERVLRIEEERGCRPTSVTVGKILRGTNPERFDLAEMVLQKVVEAGEVIQVDCVDLLRHFVMGNIRNKAVRVFRAFVVQRHRHPNEAIPFAIASLAMKLGPFDWALGVLAILLATIDKPLGKGVQSRIRYAAHDMRSREVLAALDKCDWRRERLLTVAELQEPGSSNNTNGNGAGGGGGASSGSHSELAWVDPKNHHRSECGTTWMGAMHIALMEMNVETEVLDAYKEALQKAILKATENRSNTGTN